MSGQVPVNRLDQLGPLEVTAQVCAWRLMQPSRMSPSRAGAPAATSASGRHPSMPTISTFGVLACPAWKPVQDGIANAETVERARIAGFRVDTGRKTNSH